MTVSGRAACVQCGTEITSFTGRRRLYCSDACRQAACRERRSLEARVWEGTTVRRRQSDGYVNATTMCQAGGKKWFDYIRLDRTDAYIAALDRAVRSAGNPADLIRSVTTGPNHLRGTWIHPRLAVDLARWISPAFAVWMDGWFLEAATSQPAPRRRRARRITPSPATMPAIGTAAGEELFRLLSAICPYLQEKEWHARMLGEPEEGQAYNNLLVAITRAQLTVGQILRVISPT